MDNEDFSEMHKEQNTAETICAVIYDPEVLICQCQSCLKVMSGLPC